MTNPSKTGLFVDNWGYQLSDAEELLGIYRSQAVQDLKIIENGKNQYGQLFKIETILDTPKSGQVKFYSGWIIENGDLSTLKLSSPFVDWIN